MPLKEKFNDKVFIERVIARPPQPKFIPAYCGSFRVMITVFMQAYVGGVMGESLEKKCCFQHWSLVC